MSAEIAGSPPRISTEWSLAGQPAVVLENRYLRAVLLPGLGGKIISLVDKIADAELLWRNSRVPVRAVPFGAAYDDVFLGGWDELFPNDEPEILADEAMPDHGELWALPWTLSDHGARDDQAWVELVVRPPISATSVSKRLVLGGGPELRVDHRFSNDGRHDLPYLWKSHVAVRLHRDSTLAMGAGTVLLHEFGDPRARPAAGRFTWPGWTDSDGVHDFRRLPDTSERGVCEFLLATSLVSGECGVTHPAAATGLTLSWDVADLPSCWTFASYGGGWRGLEVLVLEPCTGYPLSVVEGVAAGSHQVLPAGAARQWTVTASVGPTAR